MIACSTCGKTPKTEATTRIPPGWKRKDDGIFCRSCWTQRYILRAITLPVAGPVDRNWPEFREAIRGAWASCTAAANWMTTQFYARDVRRGADDAKLPSMPKVYLYPEARALFPDLDTRTLCSLEQALRGKYRAIRYPLLWTNEVTLSKYRYPYPIPLHNQAWIPLFGPDNVPLVNVPLGRSGRWVLRLRGGHDYRRPLGSFAKLVSGAAVKGELAIYRQRANDSDHRNGANGRDSGGQQVHYRILCKMVAWLPREEAPPREGVLFVTTPSDALLRAINAKDERLWTIHAEHVLRWIAAHRRRLSGWSDDRKMEIRGQPSIGPASRSDAACAKQRNRMKTACDQFSAQVVNYAARHRFAEVRLVGGESEYAREFPWYVLREMIERKCHDRGIAYRCEQQTEGNDDDRIDGEDEVVGVGV